MAQAIGRTGLLLLLLAGVLVARPLAAQLQVTTRALEITIGGQAQVLYSTTDQEPVPQHALELRRMRLDFRARVTPIISARIQSEFSGGTPGVRHAYLALDLPDGTSVLVGNTFRPFGHIAQVGSTRTLPAERGVRIRGLPSPGLDHYNTLVTLGYAERDIGVQLRRDFAEAPMRPSLAAGVLAGPVQVPGAAAYQLSARGTARPLPEMGIGAGWSRRHFAEAGDAGGFTLRPGHAFQADIELGGYLQGPHLILEGAMGAADPFTDAAFRAAHLWLGYRTPPAGPHALQLEPLVRLSHSAIDEPFPVGGGTLATLGVNLYAGPLNRVGVNFDRWTAARPDVTAHSFKILFQTAF
jgi:hypothetical protein